MADVNIDVIPLLDKSQKGKIKFWAKYIRCMKNKADTTHLVQKYLYILNSQHILKKKIENYCTLSVKPPNLILKAVAMIVIN